MYIIQKVWLQLNFFEPFFPIPYQQGSYLFTTYRPVEQLKQLFIQSQGFDSDSVRAFFKLYKVSREVVYW